MNHVLTEHIPTTLEGFADVFQVTLGEKTTHSHGYLFPGSLCADGERGTAPSEGWAACSLSQTLLRGAGGCWREDQGLPVQEGAQLGESCARAAGRARQDRL